MQYLISSRTAEGCSSGLCGCQEAAQGEYPLTAAVSLCEREGRKLQAVRWGMCGAEREGKPLTLPLSDKRLAGMISPWCLLKHLLPVTPFHWLQVGKDGFPLFPQLLGSFNYIWHIKRGLNQSTWHGGG